LRIVRLSVHSFRNLEDTVIEPGPRFNVMEGDNAQGKTNLLEAVHMLAAMRSFRARRNDDVIRWGEKAARVSALVDGADSPIEVRLDLVPGAKSISVDGKRMRRIEDCFGHLTAVLFCPEDLALSRGGPSERRRFLDRAIANVDRSHVRRARNFETALRNRNAALREGGQRAQGAVLDVYDCAVASTGAAVTAARVAFMRAFTSEFSQVAAEVASGAFTMGVAYASTVCDVTGLGEQEMERRLLDTLRARRGSDLRRGATTAGPHSDDIALSVDGRPAQAHASEGQHRILVLCLKAAEIRQVRRTLGFYPVLLLDDVSSELDARRNAVLMEYLRGQGGQVFITTTDRRHVMVGEDARYHMIRGGRIESE
jgi:DNA replication and repair protein RecF